eukprot:2018612-Amphidinium_carterae.1
MPVTCMPWSKGLRCALSAIVVCGLAEAAIATDSSAYEHGNLRSQRRLGDATTTTCKDICGHHDCVFLAYGCYVGEQVKKDQTLGVFLVSTDDGISDTVLPYSAAIDGQVTKLTSFQPGDACESSSEVGTVDTDVDAGITFLTSTTAPRKRLPDDGEQIVSPNITILFLRWLVKT